jgi:ABC-type branched-subunit amino acid transport system substrate-binding protein
MKGRNKGILLLVCILTFMFLAVYAPSVSIAAETDKKTKTAKADPIDMWQAKPNAAFDASKMGDMSDFDPATWTSPTGDTIKIALVASFSGPAVIVGQQYWAAVSWVAHDINKRGGIVVDGKKKLVQVIKADSMGKIDQTKKICERMILQEKVDVLWGCDGSQIVKVMNEVANQYKVIALNTSSSSDDIQAAENFGRYSFQGCFSSDQVARGLAYYYGQVRKKEKKFYILCQDYAFGHLFADGFKNGLKMYYPEAQIVGEDYHKLFLTDFAPYLTKIKSSGAEVIFTGDWDPDALNLAKQSQQMGVNLPFANIWIYNANTLHDVGVDGGKGWVHVGPYHSPVPFSAAPGYTKLYKAWNSQWKKWKVVPYNSHAFEHFPAGVPGSWLMQTYWLFNLMERVNSTNAEKIVQLWEGDTYRQANGKVIKMRACDHKSIQDLSAEEYAPPEMQKASFTIPPYYWYKEASYPGQIFRLPAASVLPWMDPKLDRCKGKNDWGE